MCGLLCSEQSIAPYIKELFIALKSCSLSRSSIGFCNESLLGSKYAGAWKLKTFYDSNAILLFEPGWRSGYRAGLEILVVK
jgi:hypothetical protein